MEMLNWREEFSNALVKNGYSHTSIKTILALELQIRRFFDFGSEIPECLMLENIEKDDSNTYYYWSSVSDHAECPECRTISTHYYDQRNKKIQDVSERGHGVYHSTMFNRFICENLKCYVKVFLERIPELSEEKARQTNRFRQHCVDMAVAMGGLGAEHVIRGEGSVVSDDTIRRYTKIAAAKETKLNLERDNVKVISVDDINLRKGDSSTACTVFIDEEKHKTLIIIRGTRKENVTKIMELFPSADHMSRDRATSLSTAGDACGKEQVADRFHLIQNVHKVINEALMSEIPIQIYFREGAGWKSFKEETPFEEFAYVSVEDIEMGTNKVDENTEGERLYVPDEDIELRITLAGLTEAKATKYRNTLKMLELSDQGLRSQEIADRLGLTLKDVRNLRAKATTTVNEVQQRIISRIEKYPKDPNGVGRLPEDGVRVTLGPDFRPATESIVEPYRDIVVEMWNSGSNYETIRDKLADQGFTGCRASIYQYIWKLEYEDPCVLTRFIKRKERKYQSLSDTFDIMTAIYTPEVSLEQISRNTIYNEILKEGRSERPDDILSKRDNAKPTPKTNRPAMAKYSPLDPELLDLMYGVEEEIKSPSKDDIQQVLKKTSKTETI